MSDESERGAEAVQSRPDLVDRLNEGDPEALLELLEEAGGKITGPIHVRLVPAKERIVKAG